MIIYNMFIYHYTSDKQIAIIIICFIIKYLKFRQAMPVFKVKLIRWG